MATILIVEERPVNRRFVATLLQDRGHRLFQATDSEGALRIVRAEKPDLVLIDVLAPSMDGCQFVLNLRSEPGLVQPRVVFRAAAYIEAEARALASAFGASFAAKPADPETLLAVVDAALAAPPPPPGEPHPEHPSIDTLLRPIARKIHRHTAILERQNAELDRGITERDAQLEVARAALEQEIRKRLLAEQELTQANLRLRDQAARDGLTGLYNRRYLEESLGREESRARRSGQPLGVMMIDIDGFKRFNDTLGHAAGDAVLRAIGQYLPSAARGEDIASRYGGEEFVLVMAQAPQATVRERAEKLRRGVNELEIEYEGQRVGPVTVSVGIGIFPDHGDSGQEVLRVADVALYRAKQSGRNCVVIGDKAKT
ncbi:MAG: diguanylate cyclase [Betaproteobacteria bacterium]|nr:MAG: diguanylate cyclase [Betaproteobacteria bacterium]TMG79042.1 MAG: diguanylate cyclase [Betaproteobacteria bacterium]